MAGLSFCAPGVTRLVVFVDYQNRYHRARAAFGSDEDHPSVGHIRPLRLGVLLKQLGEAKDPTRELRQVRIYRGEPGTRSHPDLQSAFQRQVAAWQKSPLIEVIRRPLRYQATSFDHLGKPVGWDNGREKGIDVLLALDLVLGAVRDEYDVGILFSSDTDLVPAIDEALACGKRVENAVWKPDVDHPHPLRGTHKNIWCHQLDRTKFEWLRDPVDYLHKSGDPADL
jgi:uncharacterized LabA/DUF88 family protein